MPLRANSEDFARIVLKVVGDGGQAAGHRRRPVGRGERGQVQGHRFRAGREKTERVLVAPGAEMVPIGAVGAKRRRGFGGADKLLGLLLQEPERRRRGRDGKFRGKRIG